tara:strand:+ start:4970 stop:5692 length:723 start_codon:yes stop_codon:yes gene_type:complete
MYYNIFTIANSGYFKFCRIFVESLHKNLDLSKINKIFIGDTGLTKNELKYLSMYDKIEVVSTDYISKDTSLWGEDWLNVVGFKTKLLRELVKKEEVPIVMIDLDCMFVNDFHDLVFGIFADENPIKVCYRKEHPIPYIGSFVSIGDKEKGINFLDKWIEKIENWDGVPKESPALSQLCEEVNVCELDEKIICAYCDSKEMEEWAVKIVHFKSRYKFDNFEDDFKDRVIVRGFERLVKEFI